MFTRLFSRLTSATGVFFRTFRNFFRRRLVAVKTRIRQFTNLSRQATKLAPKALQSATAAVEKPTKREDYVETSRLFISKSFIILAIITLVVVGLLFYFLAWPWLQSKFFTARMYYQEERVEDYSGRVKLYWDEKKHTLKFQGKLEEGVCQGKGMSYDEEGLLEYEGGFANGVYEGDGTGYDAGVLRYEGEYLTGLYDGQGRLYDENGGLLYEGGFVQGVYSGVGTLYEGEQPLYQGAFQQGFWQGEGQLYQNGQLLYQGGFAQNLYDGKGQLYDSAGQLVYDGGFTQGIYNGEGKLYENGKLLYNGDFTQGIYNGKGAVYDPEGNLLYDGEIENGVYQGEGQLYQDKSLQYSGTFDGGVFSGEGSLYAGGKLLYKGGFAQGQYDGEGVLYAGEVMSYSGGFAAGKRSGEGTQYSGGVKVYAGGFAGDLYEGQGLLYYPGGSIKYDGTFAQGLYAGAGTVYNPDGTLLYTGGFLAGQYEGEGTLYNSPTDFLTAQFVAGEAATTMQIYEGGVLVYDGLATGGEPNGFGTIYDPGGAALFAGQMKAGTVDAAAIWGQNVDAVRAMLAGAELTEDKLDNAGFTVCSKALGLGVYCCFQSEDVESKAYGVYMAAAPLDAWSDAEGLEAWLDDAGLEVHSKTQTDRAGTFPQALGVDSGTYFCRTYTLEQGTLYAWCQGENLADAVVMTLWRSPEAVPEPAAAQAAEPTNTGSAAEAMDAVLASLGLAEASADAVVQAAAQEATVASLLEPVAAEGTEALYQAYGALLDCYEYDSRLAVAEENVELMQLLLDEAKAAYDQGDGDAQSVSQLEASLSSLELDAAREKAQLEIARMAAKTYAGADVTGMDLQGAIFLTDPAQLDMTALMTAVMTAAPAGSEAGELTLSASSAIINLNLAYQQVLQSQTALESVQAACDRAQEAWQIGSTSQSMVWQEQMNCNTACANLYSALASFTRQALALNRSGAAFVSASGDWFADSFTAALEADAAKAEAERTAAAAQAAAAAAAAQAAAAAAAAQAAADAAKAEAAPAAEPQEETPAAETPAEPLEETPAQTLPEENTTDSPAPGQLPDAA